MRLLSVLIIGLLPILAVAKTLEGINLPEQLTVEGQTLVLNGAGIREKFFFDIYVAALYLPARQSDVDRILQADQPWRVTMNFLYAEVDKKKLDNGWDEGFEANVPPASLSALKERLAQFKAMFPTLHKGDEAVLTYLPGKGVAVSVKGEQKGIIPGADFGRTLLSVWLGKEPVTGKLKKALLGGR